MKVISWKAAFATMNPSPVFAAVTEFAEAIVDQRRRTPFIEADDTNGSRQPQRERIRGWRIVSALCRSKSAVEERMLLNEAPDKDLSWGGGDGL